MRTSIYQKVIMKIRGTTNSTIKLIYSTFADYLNRMPTIILPTAYLPPISWWALLYHKKEIHLELQETYPKQTYRNRCHIYSASGLLPLSIPVIRTW
ncbi:MAG: hypothetical protein IPH45_12420 [Bacteroidales bacterium]|nr:hypothetical protein [Bacteroidales bacterium]